MSLILKGIDLPKDERGISIIIAPNGQCHAITSDFTFDGRPFAEAIQIPKGHGRLKDFDGDGVHPIIVDGEYMVKVDDLGEMPTILEAEE